jgi:hypothetical protein
VADPAGGLRGEPAGGHEVSGEVALFLTRLTFVLARVDPLDLGILNEKSAPYRTDMLLELGAYLGTAVEHFESGTVNETVVREAAVAVAAEAVKVWLATTGMGRP